jgi:hypothetical protein
MEKGDPGIAVSPPVPSLAKPEILFPPALAVKTKALPGVGVGVGPPRVTLLGEQPAISISKQQKDIRKLEKFMARSKGGKSFIVTPSELACMQQKALRSGLRRKSDVIMIAQAAALTLDSVDGGSR